MFFAYTLTGNSEDGRRKWPKFSPVSQEIIKEMKYQVVIGTFPETTALPFFLRCWYPGQGKNGSGGKKMDSLTRWPPPLQALPNLPISARNSL